MYLKQEQTSGLWLSASAPQSHKEIQANNGLFSPTTHTTTHNHTQHHTTPVSASPVINQIYANVIPPSAVVLAGLSRAISHRHGALSFSKAPARVEARRRLNRGSTRYLTHESALIIPSGMFVCSCPRNRGRNRRRSVNAVPRDWSGPRPDSTHARVLH